MSKSEPITATQTSWLITAATLPNGSTLEPAKLEACSNGPSLANGNKLIFTNKVSVPSFGQELSANTISK